MKVRKAEIKDAPAIAKISVETWKDAYSGLIDSSILNKRKVDDKRISDWVKNIQNSDFTVLICEDDDVLGYLWAGPARDDFETKNEIYAIYVKPDAQRKGVGSELMAEYKRIINNKNFYLYMLKNNQKAANFYRKNGGIIYKKFSRDINIGEQILPEDCFVFNS